ncbi:MAG: secretin N-terminal domain-containing protein [Deinococcaceae bacterium]
MFRIIIGLFCLLSSYVFAVPVAVLPSMQGGRLEFASSDLVRYRFDPQTGLVTLLNTQLGKDGSFPEGVFWEQRGEDLAFLVDRSSTLALSPDGLHLYVLDTLFPKELTTDVGPLALSQPMFLRLDNADPKGVAALLQRLYTGLRVEVDERQRALLILTNPENQDLIKQVVATLDAEKPQVMFEAEILEINQDTTQALGIDYENIFTFKLTEGTPKGITSFAKFARSPMTLSVGINALKNNGAARILAQPRVTTLDGLEAKINSTQTTPVLSVTSSSTTIQNITTGITLKMTPRIASNGIVEAVLSIAVSTPTGVTASGIPQFSSREASTTVRVRSGEPIAIGGLLESRTLTNEEKVPILGDLPLIGGLFTNNRTEQHRTDLVIIVTPRIVVLSEP